MNHGICVYVEVALSIATSILRIDRNLCPLWPYSVKVKIYLR